MDPEQFTVDETASGQRLDKWLSGVCGGLSRSYLQQLIAEGCLLRAGKPVTQAAGKVKSGEIYELRVPDVKPLALEPVAMALDIRFEDEHLLVINKPAGLTVHPAPGTKEPTLVHGLLAHCGDGLSGIGGVARPGIVHRLDKDTSGLMLVAKTDAAHQHLAAQLKSRRLTRVYEALCWGVPLPPAGTIDAPVGRHPKDRTRMAVVKRGGKEARTHYETLAVFPRPVYGGRPGGGKPDKMDSPSKLVNSLSLTPPRERKGEQAIASHIRCRLESGRTHQIRVHLSHIGHGLIGDPLYGPKPDNRLKRTGIDIPSETISFVTSYRRQALHAARITFTHPATDQEMTWQAGLPQEMSELLSRLNHLQNTL